MAALNIVLDKLGISQSDWNKFGVTWRAIAEKCPGQEESTVNCMENGRYGRENKLQINVIMKFRKKNILPSRHVLDNRVF